MDSATAAAKAARIGREPDGEGADYGKIAPSRPSVRRDADNDNDNTTTTRFDEDDDPVLFFGRSAGSADRRAVDLLLASYYGAAAAENGARGCSLINPVVAETVVESYGASIHLARKTHTCAAVLSAVYRSEHRRLLRDSASLKVLAVRTSGESGRVLLGFDGGANRRMTIRRYRGTWLVGLPLDMPLP